MTSSGNEEWSSLLAPLARALATMDHDILRLYQERGLEGYRSVWSQVLLTLNDDPGLTIKALAAHHRVSHATMSQRIAGMARAGLVHSEIGPDARTRVVTLTDAGADLVQFAAREWEATERVIAALDHELGGQLIATGTNLAAAIGEKSFLDRLRDQLR